MLVKNSAGGVVFNKKKVLLIKNEKEEWMLPKSGMSAKQFTNEVALQRIREDTGLEVSIISNAGETSYEFLSTTRQSPVCNKTTWYIMESTNDKYKLINSPKITDAGFFTVKDALKKISHSQDKSIVNLSFQKLNGA